ncbi:calcium-binding protein [Salipiger sp.]|uniref:calcium-binding protein n=1 Tax=Salipiger sp. TaxID=2078585 RepID=UPI003A97C871
MPLSPVNGTRLLAPVGAGSNNGEIVALPGGGYMAVWTHLVAGIPVPGIADNQFTAVIGRVFNADGTPRGGVFEVNTSVNVSGQGDADIVVLSNGNLAVSWTDGPDLSNGVDVSAWVRILRPDGTPVTDPIMLATETLRDQDLTDLAPYGNGGFIATWQDARDPWTNTTSPWVAQIFDASGNRVGAEFYVAPDSASWQGELLNLGNDLFVLNAEIGTVFELGATHSGYGGLRTPVVNQPFTGFGDAQSDTINLGNGSVGFIESTASGIRVRIQAPVAFATTGPDYADGTPYADHQYTLQFSGDAPIQNLLLAWPDNALTFTPVLPSVAATVLPNGNIALAWSQTTGGTAIDPVVSVYAQILSPEGVILSDAVMVQEGGVFAAATHPPFIAGGIGNQIFVGWTGYSGRNGPATADLEGGVFDIPLNDYSANTAGDDTIHGTDGNDTLTGRAGADVVFLFDGDDLYRQGADGMEDYVYGMAGNDRFVVTSLSAGTSGYGTFFYGGPGYDTTDLSTLSQGVYYDRNGNDSHAPFTEELIGTLFDDVLYSGLGEGLRIHAEAGNDEINYGRYDFAGEIDGGTGTDILTTYLDRSDFVIERVGDHYEMYYTGSFNGSTLPDGSPRYVAVLRSIEEIHFRNGADVMTLETTATRASGRVGTPSLPPPGAPTEAADSITGTSGADSIDLLGGNDTYDGLGGNDSILGGAGDDSLTGGDGNDTIDGGAGGDFIDGGAGRDVVSYTSATRSVRVDLQNTQFMYGDAVGDTFANVEVFQTGDTVDQLRGDSGSNVFYTGGLSDRLYGRAGNDFLFGQTGADAFYGGLGADTMTGGPDEDRRDRYIYFNIAESGVGAGNRDVITDFVSGEDRIEIRRFDADTTQGNKQYFDFVGDAGLSGTAGELAYVHEGGNTIVQADVDGDGLADFEIELTGVMDLTADDFLI